MVFDTIEASQTTFELEPCTNYFAIHRLSLKDVPL